MIISLLLLCLFKADLVAGAGGHYGGGHSSDWNYHDDGKGPANWSTPFPHCGENHQSPINILTKDVKYNKDLGTLVLKNYDQINNVSFIMDNRNTDIQFTAKADAGLVPQTVTFKDTTYRLFQFHFHWGSKDFQGSEHTVDCQQYAGEMHIIHYNDKYANVSVAIDKSDGLLVWGNFLKVDSTNKVADADFQTLLGNFAKAEECCDTTKLSFSLKALLPSIYDQFYHYSGSLTTPPCYQSVSWIVNRHPILVSQDQMKEFRMLKDVKMGNITLQDHYRPTQPLNGREVERNFDPSKDGCTDAGVSVKPFSTIIFIFVAAVTFIM